MVHGNEWDLEEGSWEVVPHDSFSPPPYSALSLYQKLPSFTSIDDENDPLLNLYHKENEHYTFQTKHILPKYFTTEEDYFYEAAFMLRLINQPQGWESKMNTLALIDDTVDRRHKHLVLYNFIALSLVRKARGDVCAVALYQSPTSVEVYYSKNRPRGVDADVEIAYDTAHAKEMTTLIRECAKVRTTSAEFKSQFFKLLYKNCFEKLNRRLSTLQSSCDTQARGSNIRSVIDEVRTIIAGGILPKTVYTEADMQAIELAQMEELPSAVEFVLLELLKVLKEIPKIQGQSKAPTTSNIARSNHHTLLNISLLSWIVGQSSILRSILNMTRSTAIAKLLSSLRKFGQYYRGCELLHTAIINSKMNQLYQTLIVRQVASPAPEMHKMCTEWYKVLDTIYHRTRHRGMLLPRSQFVEAYPSINDYDDEWPTQTFVRHAEVCLIDHLMKSGRRPAEIGVSKLCCRACYVWIDGVNENLREKGAGEVWTVSGTHGKYYPWQRDSNSRRVEGENNVLKDLYAQLAEKVDQVYGPHADSDRDFEEGAPVKVRSTAAEEYKKQTFSVRLTSGEN